MRIRQGSRARAGGFEPLHFRIGIREDSQPGAAGLEPLHLGIRSAALAVAQSAHLTPFVGHPRLLPTRCAPDHFRMASPSLTHTESGRARNAAKWRHFAHKGGLGVRKLVTRVGGGTAGQPAALFNRRSPALRASSASQVATDLVAATNYSWLKPFVCGLASSGASGPSTAAMGNPLV